jgi:hypothetical protein
MASVHIGLQFLLFAVVLGAAFLLQRPLQSLATRFVRSLHRWSNALFFGINFFGLFTTNLLSMSWFHVCELLVLALVFARDAIVRDLTPTFRFHHVLGVVGLCLQVHIGVGGAMMSYLLVDQVTDYVHNRVAFWIVFLLVRIGLYNTVLAVAVRQGLRAASASLAIAVWVGCVATWWAFSNFYHFRWMWRMRAEIKRLFFGGAN